MSTVQTHEKEDTKDLVHKANPEYPFAMYDPKTGKAKGAKDKEEYDKLTGQGYTEDPPPPQDPDALTADEVKTLQALLAKAAKALEKLGKLSQQEQTPSQTSAHQPPPAPSKGK